MKLDGQSIQAAMLQLQEDYKFNPYQVLEIIKQGIKSGFKKDFPEYKKSEIVIDINGEGVVTIYKQVEVKNENEIEDEEKEITLKEASKIRKDITVGEKLLINITPESLELSRIASQAAAQTIKQSLKNVEREKFFEKFKNKQGELLRAKVIRIHADSIILDIEGSTVVLTTSGQIPHRAYEVGEDIFVLLEKIAKDSGGITLDITQSSADYIEAILRKIVPELEEGIVKIEKIARLAGRKSKILVSSMDEKIDPIGVMVGHQGDRINTILSLLDGEKIDYIEKVDDTITLLKTCLKPAHIRNIEIKNDKAFVYVEEGEKALAIGKGASNVKLAAQICGMNVEIV